MRRCEFLDKLVSASAFNQGQATKIFKQVTDDHEIVILKNNRPQAVIISPDQYKSYCALAEECNALLKGEMIPKEDSERICTLLKHTKLYMDD